MKTPRPDNYDNVDEVFVETENNRGYMLKEPDAFMLQFARYSAGRKVLDIGAAFGVATIAALEAGAAAVVANDAHQNHLDGLYQKTPEALRDKLTLQVGLIQALNFADNSFDAILCSRIIHFLTPAELEKAFHDLHTWLKPGGKLFLVCDTPYCWGWQKLIPEFERKKAEGHPWPSFMENFAGYLNDDVDPSVAPDSLHPLDKDHMVALCEDAGFTIESANYIDRANISTYCYDGREGASVVAIKP